MRYLCVLISICSVVSGLISRGTTIVVLSVLVLGISLAY
jgi:hypothetical protein